MLKQTILLISSLMVLAGCAGKSQDSYTSNSNTSYTDQPPIYYEYPPVPKTTPPVQYNPYAAPQAPLSPQPVPVFPQEYRYSGVQDGQYHWGRVTVDTNGQYRGWDNENGFTWGTIRPQGYYQPPAPPSMPVYPQEYNYSGIQNGEYHWGNVTVQPDGSYSGFDNKGGFYYGSMQLQ